MIKQKWREMRNCKYKTGKQQARNGSEKLWRCVLRVNAGEKGCKRRSLKIPTLSLLRGLSSRESRSLAC